MKKLENLLWGLVFIVVGVIVGSNALGFTNIDIFFDGWWTLFIIVPCFIGLLSDTDKTGSLIGLLLGVALLFACNDIINFDLLWKLLLPIILIVIGLSMIFKNTISTNFTKEIKKLNQNRKDNNECCATFSSQNIDFDNEEFKGCDLTAVFGGVKCDLRKAKLDKDAVINASSVFGGIDILVPDDVKVKVKSTSIFGGVSNKKNNSEAQKTIYLNATCIFGGIEIK